jgi:ATP synthase protein I
LAPTNGRNVRNYYRGLGGYGTVGLELVLSILFGFLAGRWVDQKLDTHGWITIFGFGLGTVAGFRSLYRAAVRMRDEAEAKDDRDRRERAGKASDGEADDDD